MLVSSNQGNAAIHSYDLQSGLFLRSYYVLAQEVAGATGFDVAPPSPLDCNLNLLPDACDIAAATALDCNGNTVPDECDISAGTSPDANRNGIPDECECPANVNGDSVVDVQDLVEVLLAWGPCPACAADVNGDDVVDVQDLVAVVLAWGPC